MINDIVKDTLRYIPSIAGPAILGILTVILVSKAFTPSEYGSYILVLTTVNFAGIVSYYWLDSSIIRYLPHYIKINEENRFYGAVLTLAILSVAIFGLLFGITLYSLKDRMDNNLYTLMLIGAFLFSLLLFYDVGLTVLKAKRMIRIYTYFYIWRWATPVLFGLTIVYFYYWSIESLLWGNIFGLLVALPFLYHIVFRPFVLPFSRRSFDMLVAMVCFGLPFIPTYLVSWILRFSDRYFLEVYKGSNDVGLYSIGYDISERTVGFIIMLFSIASNPILTYAWEKDSKESVEALISLLIRYYIIASLPFVALVSVLSKEILIVFTQSIYIAAWKIVPFVALAAFVTGLQWFVQRGLMFVKKTVLIMYAFLCCSAVNIFLNLVLIPRYGFVAAGVSTFISYVLLLGLMIVFSGKYFKASIPVKTLINCSIGVVPLSIVAMLIIYLIPQHLIVSLCVACLLGSAIYIFCLILLKEFSIVECDKMKKMILKYARL